LAYQYTFYDKHGRWPTWADAIAHCAEDIKRLWIEELTAYGITEEDFEIEVSVDNSENRTNQGD
jgi:hypothetical protein